MSFNLSDPYAPFQHISAEPQAIGSLSFWLMGPVMMGILTHGFLFGIVATTFFLYLNSHSYTTDSRRIRCLAYAIVGVDFLSVIVNTSQGIFYAGTANRSATTLILGTFAPDSFAPMLVGVEALLVQLYLVRRASRLFVRQRKLKRAFLIIATTLAILSFLASIVVTVFFWMYFARIPFADIYISQIVSGCWLMIAALLDCMISLTLTLLIRNQLKALMVESTHANGVLRKLMGRGLETALYTSVMAVAGAFTAICFPSSKVWTINVFFSFTYPLPSLYAFSFLITLQTRGTSVDPAPFSVSPVSPAIIPVITRQSNVMIDLGFDEELRTRRGNRNDECEKSSTEFVETIHSIQKSSKSNV